MLSLVIGEPNNHDHISPPDYQNPPSRSFPKIRIELPENLRPREIILPRNPVERARVMEAHYLRKAARNAYKKKIRAETRMAHEAVYNQAITIINTQNREMSDRFFVSYLNEGSNHNYLNPGTLLSWSKTVIIYAFYGLFVPRMEEGLLSTLINMAPYYSRFYDSMFDSSPIRKVPGAINGLVYDENGLISYNSDGTPRFCLTNTALADNTIASFSLALNSMEVLFIKQIATSYLLYLATGSLSKALLPDMHRWKAAKFKEIANSPRFKIPPQFLSDRILNSPQFVCSITCKPMVIPVECTHTHQTTYVPNQFEHWAYISHMNGNSRCPVDGHYIKDNELRFLADIHIGISKRVKQLKDNAALYEPREIVPPPGRALFIQQPPFPPALPLPVQQPVIVQQAAPTPPVQQTIIVQQPALTPPIQLPVPIQQPRPVTPLQQPAPIRQTAQPPQPIYVTPQPRVQAVQAFAPSRAIASSPAPVQVVQTVVKRKGPLSSILPYIYIKSDPLPTLPANRTFRQNLSTLLNWKILDISFG